MDFFSPPLDFCLLLPISADFCLGFLSPTLGFLNNLYTAGDAINNYAMMLHEQKGDVQGADALYQKAYDNNPEDVDILFNWVRFLRNLKN